MTQQWAPLTEGGDRRAALRALIDKFKAYRSTSDAKRKAALGWLEETISRQTEVSVFNVVIYELEALLDGPAMVPAADYDWKKFCVNHEGFNGPTAHCPTCQKAGKRGD